MKWQQHSYSPRRLARKAAGEGTRDVDAKWWNYPV
jgi:hypothetical protein